MENYARFQGAAFDDAEPELGRDLQRAKGRSRLAWEDAREAARDSWNRLSTNIDMA